MAFCILSVAIRCRGCDIFVSVFLNDVIMSARASQIPSLMIIYSTIYSGADHRKHQSSKSLAFVRGIHRWPVNAPHKRPVTRRLFPFDDVIMIHCARISLYYSYYACHWKQNSQRSDKYRLLSKLQTIIKHTEHNKCKQPTMIWTLNTNNWHWL